MLALQGCMHYPSAVDAQFGSAVKQAVTDQSVHPASQTAVRPPALTDGQAAKSAVDRYQKSFDVPPLPTNVFNIGVGAGANTSAR